MFGTTDEMRFTVDLSRPLKRGNLEPLLFTQDNAGADLVLDLVDGDGSAVSVASLSAQLNFIRPDGVTVLLDGTKEAAGFRFTLTAACLEAAGGGEMLVRAYIGSTRRVIWCADCVIHRSATDSYADPAKIVPTLTELLAQIDAMRTATAAATAAAQQAENVASSVQNTLNTLSAKVNEALAEAQAATRTYVRSVAPTGEDLRTGDRWVNATVTIWGDAAASTWGTLANGTWADLVSGVVSGESVYVFGSWQSL